MGKVIEQIRLTNIFDPSKSVAIDAVIDSGATMLSLPQDIVDQLALRKGRDAKVRYANNHVEDKSLYGVVEVELLGRAANFDVLAEKIGATPSVGQVVLEVLDLVIDPKSRKLIPNPASPETPMVEILQSVL